MSVKKKPIIKFQKIVTIIIIVVSVLSITGILLDEPIIINLELNKISDIDLKNSVFKTNGILLNNFRDTVIFPDDKLTYKTNLVNNHEDYVNYFVSLTLMQGGNPVSYAEFENRTLVPNGGWTSYQTEFFVGEEGTKELKINFVGKHPTTNEVIIHKTFSKDLQIQSLSDKIQSDQTFALSIGVIASSVIGGITATALILNQKTAKKEVYLLEEQSKEIRNQSKIQNRPWIGEATAYLGHEVYLNNKNEEKDDDEWNLLNSEQKNAFNVTKIRRYIEIKNFGTLPATKVVCKGKFFIDTIPSKHDVERISPTSSATLMPNATTRFKFNVTIEEEKAAKDPSQKCYFGWETEYQSINSQVIRKYGFISKLTTHGYEIIESWGS